QYRDDRRGRQRELLGRLRGEIGPHQSLERGGQAAAHGTPLARRVRGRSGDRATEPGEGAHPMLALARGSQNGRSLCSGRVGENPSIWSCHFFALQGLSAIDVDPPTRRRTPPLAFEFAGGSAESRGKT